jgi:hypothetical protein
MDDQQKVLFAKYVLAISLKKFLGGFPNEEPPINLGYIEDNLDIISNDFQLQREYLAIFGNGNIHVRREKLCLLVFSIGLRDSIQFVTDYIFFRDQGRVTLFLNSTLGSPSFRDCFNIQDPDDLFYILDDFAGIGVGLNIHNQDDDDGDFADIFNNLNQHYNEIIGLYLKFLTMNFQRMLDLIEDSVLYSFHLRNHLKSLIKGFGFSYQEEFNSKDAINSIFFLFMFRKQLKFILDLLDYFGNIENKRNFVWKRVFLMRGSLFLLLPSIGGGNLNDNHIYLVDEEFEDFNEVLPPFELPEGVQVITKQEFFERFWN